MSVTTATAQTSQHDLDRLAKSYSFRREDEVTAFLQEYPQVGAVLLEAIDIVPRYFGPDAPVVLEVERDRYTPSHIQLFALIQTDLDVEPSMGRLQRFDDEWWLDALPRADGKLIFGLEPV